MNRQASYNSSLRPPQHGGGAGGVGSRPSSLPSGGQRRAASGSASTPRGGGSDLPTGRQEMLRWIHHVSGRSPYNHAASEGGGNASGAAAMEGLRDAMCYILAFVKIIEESNGGAGTIVADAEAVADDCYLAIRDKVSQNIQLGPSPSKDSIQVAGLCEKNFQVLQGMIREHLPKRLGIEMDTTKLSKGLLQDHMVLMKWLVGLWKRMNTVTPTTASAPPPPASVASRGPSATAARGSKPQQQQNLQQQTSRKEPSDRDPPLSPRQNAVSAASQPPNSSLAAASLARLLELEKEVIAFEQGIVSADEPGIDANDVQSMQEQRDYLSGTLEQIVEMLLEPGRQSCPLQRELLRTLRIR